jgi:uncharacterized membrane protein YdbT with pleckstrin-like domain
MEPGKLSKLGKKLFDVIEFDDNEQLICEIRKHPFGLFIIYLSGIAIAVLLFAVCLLAAWFIGTEFSSVEGDIERHGGLFTLVGLVLALLALLVTGIAGHIYNSNIMLVTNEKIAQVLYKSLFNRKISQLSIGDVQDVTVTQNGVFTRIFNYGTIVVETAGEQQNYTFTFAPNPYYFAKKMVGAHERNLHDYGN